MIENPVSESHVLFFLQKCDSWGERSQICAYADLFSFGGEETSVPGTADRHNCPGAKAVRTGEFWEVLEVQQTQNGPGSKS